MSKSILTVQRLRNILTKGLTNIQPQENQYKQSSYSQCGEDLIMNFIFNSLHIEKPSYLDIGAHHPFWLSNTFFFYKKGSRGINIEPNPQLIAQFNKYRKEDINLNIGISGSNDELDFYIMSAPTMSTFSFDEAKRLEQETAFRIIEKRKIVVKHIQTVLDDNNCGVFPDFLSLDVEGLEYEILSSIDFVNNFPKVICIETLSYSENKKERKETNLMNFLIDKGYFKYGDTYINTIFVNESVWKNR